MMKVRVKPLSKKPRSDALAAIRETMLALHDVGAIDEKAMQRFDLGRCPATKSLKTKTSCKTPVAS